MTVNDILTASLGCTLLVGSMILLELLVRRMRLSSELSRRVAHIGAGLFAIYLAANVGFVTILVCALLLMGLMTISYLKGLFSSVHSVERHTYGELYLPLGIFGAYLLASQSTQLFVTAILITTFADVAAGLVSDIRQLKRPTKIGSAVFFVVTVIILQVMGFLTPSGLGAAFVLTVCERISKHGSDNLTVPVAAVVVLLSL